MSGITWLLIVTLIAVNALYVAAEFGAVAVRRSRVRQRAEDGDRLAKRLLPVLDDARQLDRYIACCQIGITISSLVLGAYGQLTLAVALEPHLTRLAGLDETAGETAAVIVLIGLTVVQMVFGELIPKSVALQYPTQTALYTVLPMEWSLRAMGWFIAILNGSGLAILRRLGVHGAGHRHIHSPEEIELLIAESREGGMLKPDEDRRLRRALRLGMRPVADIMVPRTALAAVPASAPLADALGEFRRGPYTRLPAYRDSLDDIVGLVHAKDAALLVAAGRDGASVADVLRPILLVPQTLTGEQLLTRMREQRCLMAVVLDEFGGTAGLVTLDDILEEILGDLEDELKPGGAERLADGRVRLPGDLRLDEAEPWLGLAGESHARTVGGLVMELLGRVPRAGERVKLGGAELEVERLAGQRVASVLATPIRPRQQEESRG